VIASKRRPAIRAGIYSSRGMLRAAAPSEFERSLDFLGAFAPTQSSHRVANGTVTAALALGGDVVVARMEAAGGPARPRLRYTLWSGAPISRALQARVESRIGTWLGLGDDLRPFYRLAARDRRFAPVVKVLYGYHPVTFPTPFESACWAVLTQRNRMAIARGMRDRVVERFGGALEVNGVIYRAFPEPARVVVATDEDLRAVAGQERRARYLRAVARAFDGVDDASLRTGDYDDVDAWLRAIPGIGPWSARFVLLRGLGRMDRIDGAEIGVGRAFARVYGAPHDAAASTVAAAIARAAARYGRWQGYWLHYLRAAPPIMATPVAAPRARSAIRRGAPRSLAPTR
jgi:DNA-3-methyladenine glycosylase II